MKSKEKTIPAKVYQLLADEIENLTCGLEYHEGEAEVIHNNLTYAIQYSIRRESNTVMITDYDSQNVYDERRYVSVTEMEVFDENGDAVSMTMDTDEITKYFDPWPCYTDED